MDKFYVLTERELKDLLHKQRVICFMPESKDVLNAPEPDLPPLLSEWGVINKITKNNH